MEDISILQGALITLFLLQAKHFLADFVWQTNQMVQEKGIYGARHGIYHSLIQAAGTFLAFAWMHPVLGFITALVDFLAHYHIDWAKMNLSSQWQPHHWAYWVWFGADQLAHALTYIAIVAIIAL